MTKPRLPQGPDEAKSHPDAMWRRANPHSHEDAMSDLLGRDARPIARELGLAGRTVRQWRERHDSDHRGPGRTIALAVRAALEVCGRDVEDAVAPIRALADEFGFDLVPRHEHAAATDVQHGAVEVIRESSEAVARVLESVADQRIDLQELRECDGEISEAISALHQLRRKVEASYRESQDRVGPRGVAS